MDSIRTMLGRPVVPLLLMTLAVLVAGCAQVGTATWNFWDMIWSLIALFFWVMLIWIFIAIFGDIFRRNDLSGGMKAVWIIALVFLPFLGAIIYMISRPKVTAQDVQMMTQAEAAPAGRRQRHAGRPDRQAPGAQGGRGHHRGGVPGPQDEGHRVADMRRRGWALRARPRRARASLPS